MTFLFALAFVFFPYISLEVSLPLGGHTLNAPLGDLCALGLVVVHALDLLRPPRLRPPGLAGYVLLLGVGLVAARHAPSPAGAVHFLLRKPVFVYLVYGVGMAGVAMRLGRRGVRDAVTVAALTLAALSLYASADRIVHGSALWPDAPLGLTNNHKTLAVAGAPLVPLVLGLDRKRAWVAALLGVALLLSWSRTSWISAFVGLAFFVRWRGRLLAARRGLLAVGVAVGIVLSTYGPVLAQAVALHTPQNPVSRSLATMSAVQLDAARSRHSLDRRAWQLFTEHPLVGAGGDTNIVTEMHTWPDYRINGVDAHGVVQKVGSEFGLLGLLGYGLFVGATALRLRGRHVDGDPLWPTFLALHTNLLLSTETFTQTHWAPLALVWGLAQAREP